MSLCQKVGYQKGVSGTPCCYVPGNSSNIDIPCLSFQGHVSEPSLYPSPVSRGITPQGLPPPPTKQSIKAANAGKFKAGKQPSIEQFSGMQS